LEKCILPFFAVSRSHHRVLFVGVANYTARYYLGFEGKEFWTIDFDLDKRKYGSDLHVVGSITAIDKYFEREYFDAIFLCGVVGWGLNNKDDIESAIIGIHRCLRSNGVLIVSWCDIPSRSEMVPALLRGLRIFSEYSFPPLGCSEYKKNTWGYGMVTFNFYRK
jgi:hypothetical protein